MPNVLDASGLTIATKEELMTEFTTLMQEIYGNDINLESNTPDGQLLNIFVQAIVDVQELLLAIYNSFNPDAGIGRTLDQRVAINGIQRQGGTYTSTPITVVVTQSINLYGLDQTTQDIYTISDNAGNLWQLEETQIGLSIGTHVLDFRSAVPGAVTTTLNTITTPVTIVLGVQSVNNPSTYTVLGVDEESDGALKIRRARSVSLASQGYLAGLLGSLENIDGMGSAYVYENLSSTVDENGVEGHSIWVIVSGTAAPADIAQAIYTKRNAGVGMKGTQSYDIVQVDGTIFTVRWDNVIYINLYIAFTATSINGITQPNIAAIRDGLPLSFVPKVFDEVNINTLATRVQEIDPNTLVTDAGFSTGQTQTLTLSGIPASGSFILNYNGHASAAINWNDTNGQIQTKLQAITGLSSATVAGTLGGLVLTFDFSPLTSVEGLLYVTSNTLATSAPAPITFSYDEGYTTTLAPSSKQYQFVVLEQNIIITPIIVSPGAVSLATLGTQAFSAYGGYGAYTYSLLINNSGGSINASTGSYTAGGSPGLDTIQAKDVLGNTATANATVT